MKFFKWNGHTWRVTDNAVNLKVIDADGVFLEVVDEQNGILTVTHSGTKYLTAIKAEKIHTTKIEVNQEYDNVHVDICNDQLQGKPETDDYSYVYEQFDGSKTALVIGNVKIVMSNEQAERVRYFFENT